ncbi:MAG: YhfC family glutamic-type intramembrane protease, partial [Myxococcota bacterium]
GDDPAHQRLGWGAALSVVAGIVEETSRYLYYRRTATLRDPEARPTALAVGLAHGTTEAWVLGLQFVVAPAVMLLAAPELLPPELSDPDTLTGYALIGGVSRLGIVVGHAALALLVWRAVSRRAVGWYLLAVAVHIGVDLSAFVLPDLVPGTDWVAGVAIVALAGFAAVELRTAVRRTQEVPVSA